MGLCRPPCHTWQVPSRLPPASILLLYHRYHHHSLFWPLSRFQRSPLRNTVLYGKHQKEQICKTQHSVLISWVALSSFIVCSSVRRGDISFSFPPLKAFTIYLHCAFSQVACQRWNIITLVAFVWLFSAVCLQMCPQIACSRRCIITQAAFVWFFSLFIGNSCDEFLLQGIIMIMVLFHRHKVERFVPCCC